MPIPPIDHWLRVDAVSLKPSEQIQAHVQETWELAYIICGRGVRTIGDQSDHFREGEVVLVPPRIKHGWAFDKRHTDQDGHISNIALFFPPSALHDLRELLPDFEDTIKNLQARKEAVAFQGSPLTALQKAIKSIAQTENKELKFVRFLELLHILGNTSDSEITVGSQSYQTRTQSKYEKIRIYCECNFMRDITLQDAALHVGMNVSSFCKFFQKNFGNTFSEHINQLRIEECRRQLKLTEEPIADIAYGAGFCSVPYFNRVFQRICDCTPSAYRHSHTADLVSDKKD